MDTLEIRDSNKCDGKLLASPYLDDNNNKSGDKCLYIGARASENLWTAECDATQPLQTWNFVPVEENSAEFHLVNGPSGKCLRPLSNDSGSVIRSFNCTTEDDLVWTWFDGE